MPVGSSRTRFPVAWNIALATAAFMPTVPISPMRRILAQQIGENAALKPLTVQPPFAARHQQAVGDQHEQHLIPMCPFAAHPKPR
jgi:hypothetical protein